MKSPLPFKSPVNKSQVNKGQVNKEEGKGCHSREGGGEASRRDHPEFKTCSRVHLFTCLPVRCSLLAILLSLLFCPLSFASGTFVLEADGWHAPDKHPGSTLDYLVNWAGWLYSGDTITGSTWTVDSGLVVDAESFTASGAVIWISGGTADQVYNLVNTITTAGGRVEYQTFKVLVREF